MNKILCALLVGISLVSAITQEEQYLETKRRQLEIQTREFNEARQALEAYKSSFEAVQNQKMQALLKKEAEINATLAKIEQMKAENEHILRQNEENLKAIDEKSTGRVQEIYSQMENDAIAKVLTEMNPDEASKIMLSLEPRKISGVLAEMEAKKASELTLLIKNLDTNATTETNSSRN